jgi:hypothetical protein
MTKNNLYLDEFIASKSEPFTKQLLVEFRDILRNPEFSESQYAQLLRKKFEDYLIEKKDV